MVGHILSSLPALLSSRWQGKCMGVCRLSLCVVAIYSDWSRDHNTSTPLKPKWYNRAAAGVSD